MCYDMMGLLWRSEQDFDSTVHNGTGAWVE